MVTMEKAPKAKAIKDKWKSFCHKHSLKTSANKQFPMSCTGAIGGPEHHVCTSTWHVEVHHQRAILSLDQEDTNSSKYVPFHFTSPQYTFSPYLHISHISPVFFFSFSLFHWTIRPKGLSLNFKLKLCLSRALSLNKIRITSNVEEYARGAMNVIQDLAPQQFAWDPSARSCSFPPHNSAFHECWRKLHCFFWSCIW